MSDDTTREQLTQEMSAHERSLAELDAVTREMDAITAWVDDHHDDPRQRHGEHDSGMLQAIRQIRAAMERAASDPDLDVGEMDRHSDGTWTVRI